MTNAVKYLAIKGLRTEQDRTLYHTGFYTILAKDIEFNVIDSFIVAKEDLDVIDWHNENNDVITMYNRLCEVSQ